MLKNGQAYSKNLAGWHHKIFKVCLTIFKIMHERIKFFLILNMLI